VSDRLEAILAQTDELDAANVAHLAQSISEVRGKSHGLHGIHPGVLASEASPPGSPHSRSPTQQGIFLYTLLTRLCALFWCHAGSNSKSQTVFRNANDGNTAGTECGQAMESVAGFTGSGGPTTSW
jgi:hypothetical protein